mgnify:CR=1 FL=1
MDRIYWFERFLNNKKFIIFSLNKSKKRNYSMGGHILFMNLYHKDKKYPYDKDSQIKYVEDPYIFSLKDKKKRW